MAHETKPKGSGQPPDPDCGSLLEQATAVNEQLIVSSLRQHELTEMAEKLNAQLQAEIAERKTAQRSLAEQTRLLDLSHDAIIVRDVRNRITYWNHGATEMFGWTREEAIGLDLHALLKTEFEVPLEELLAKLHRENRLLGEVIQTSRAGRRIPLLCRWSLDRDGREGSGAILTTTTDITSRKLTESMLQETQERLASILESITDGFHVIDAAGRFTQFNGAAREMFAAQGVDADAALGKHVFDDIFPEARESESGKALLRAMTTRTPQSLVTFYPPWQRWLNVRFYPTPDGGVASFFQDVTERQQAEAAIRESEERFRALADNIPQLAWMTDAEGWIFWYNQRWFDYTGLTLEEMQGWGWERVHHPEHLPRILAAWRHHLQAGTRFDDTFPLRGADGQFRWFLTRAVPIRDVSGKVQRWFGTNTDVTEQRAAADAMRESEERYRVLFASVPVAVFVCDRDAVIQQHNRRAVELWGREPECGVERHCGSQRLILPDGSVLPHTQSPIVEVLRTGRPALNVEVFIEQPDGSRLPVLVNFAALKDAQGEITGAVTSFIDIAERKQAEEALRLAMVEVERGSRAKDDFLAALSHELRTPLTPVLMTATALEGDTALPLEVREQLAMMRRNIELEARLIDDLLDITRISRGKLQIAPVAADLHQLLEHTAEIVRSDGLGKQVRIVFLLEAARHHALADPTRLQQVFWNLIKNALKFTPTGGTITVSTRNDAEGWILVSVEDTGIGIAAEALPNVFNAFEQGDIAGQHRYGGLGLGLAISRAIVEVHAGAIRAESAGPGRGATFTVALATVDAPAPSARAHAPHFAPARALRLLIVEDHEATRTVLTRLLGRNGHRVTTAGTIREALAAFAAESFDAVISDLGLSDGSGLELMREIQRQRPCPGIALSGYGMEEDLRQTKEAGFFAHLVKPVNLDQLVLLLDQVGVRA